MMEDSSSTIHKNSTLVTTDVDGNVVSSVIGNAAANVATHAGWSRDLIESRGCREDKIIVTSGRLETPFVSYREVIKFEKLW